MANPLTAIAKGTGATISNAAKSAGETYMSNMPNPSKAFYNIGLGIGPMIRNIVTEMKKDSKGKDGEAEKRSKDHLETTKRSRVEVNNAMAKMQTQLAVSNALLKEIRNLQIKQITAAGKQSTVGAMAGRRMVADSDRRIAAADTGAMSSMLARDKTDEGGSYGGLAKLALGGITAGLLWKNLPDDVKDSMKGGAKEVAGAVNEMLIQPAFNMWKESFKSDTVATTIATLGVAWVTGILGKVTSAVNGTLKVWQASQALGRGAVNVMKEEKAVSGLAGQPAAAASESWFAKMFGRNKEQMVNGTPISQARTEYDSMINSSDPSVRRNATRNLITKYGAENVDAIKSAETLAPTAGAAGGAAEAAGAAKAAGNASLGSKALSAGKSALKWGSRGLGVLGVGASAWGAKENFQAGNNILGTLDTISALTGAAAIGSAVTGFGLPAAAFLGGVSALTGVASGIGGLFVDKPSATQGPTPAATSSASSPKNLLSNSEFDYQKYLTLVGQQESSNNYGIDNGVGFVGRYQFGSEALEQFGFLKKGMTAKYGSKGSDAAIYHPDAWANGLSLQKFLADAGTQDALMQKYTDAHYKALEKAGIIKKGMQDQDIARALYTAHAGGVGGAQRLYQQGQDTADFHIAGAGTRSADMKMAAMWSGNPNVSPVTNNPSALSATALASAGATTGFDMASSNDAYNQMTKQMFGSTFNIDMSKIINNALADAGGGKGAGLATYNPGNPILNMAFSAVGAQG